MITELPWLLDDMMAVGGYHTRMARGERLLPSVSMALRVFLFTDLEKHLLSFSESPTCGVPAFSVGTTRSEADWCAWRSRPVEQSPYCGQNRFKDSHELRLL